MNILTKLKDKTFWGGVLTALGGLLCGAMSVPDFFIQLIGMIGG